MQAKDFFSNVIRAAALSLICSLVGVLIFAAVVKFAALSLTTVKTVNQFIKVAAVFIGCFLSVKGKAGILKGAVAGAVGTFLLYAVFALLSGSPLFDLSMLADLGFTAAVGAIAGVIAVNVKSKE